jgi:hypothetical protein
MMLQLRVMAPIYELVPGAAFIQFPWRLLAILGPAAIAITYWALGKVMDTGRARAAAGLCTVMTLHYGGAFVPIDYDRIDLEGTAQPVMFSLFGEYLPASRDSVRPPSLATVRVAQRSAGCDVTELGPIEEGRPRHFEASCASNAAIPLPIFSHPLHRVLIEPAGVTISCSAGPGGPSLAGLCWVTLLGGTTAVEVVPPDFQSVVRSMLPGR